jgi:flagellar hook-basal body complex protein FliE
MSIASIEAIGGYVPLTLEPTGNAAGSTSGASFAATLSNGLQRVEAAQDKADSLAIQAATGTLADVHEYTIAANEAQLTTQLTVAVRNKAIEAFNEIMRLQA